MLRAHPRKIDEVEIAVHQIEIEFPRLAGRGAGAGQVLALQDRVYE